MAVDTNRKPNRVERVKRLLKAPNPHIRALMKALHASEVAMVLEDCSPDLRERIVTEVPIDIVSAALSEMDEDSNPGALLTLLPPKVASSVVMKLAPDDAADLLALVPDEFRDRLFTFVPDEEEDVINQLLTYDEDSAGGLMNPDVVRVQEGMTKLDALREVVAQSEDMDDFYTIYVVDETSHLKGYLTFRSLFLARNSEPVAHSMDDDIVSVTVDMDQEEVARLMKQYNLPTLPVVTQEGLLMGRITFDDVMDVLEEESTEDILNFAGVSEDENLRGGWADAVRSRIPWLFINLITASIAAFVISRFDGTIEKLVLLTSMMPIIAGVAGNGATQTLAVTIRRISTDGIPGRKAMSVILKELSVGMINGLMIGAVVSIFVMYINPSVDEQFVAMMGLVVFLAMFGNLMLAGFMGSVIPILLEKAGVDPAVASSILITAFTDIIGYLLLFGLASKILLPLLNHLGEAGMNLLPPIL